MDKLYRYGDRVVVTDDNYLCATKGSRGRIVDFGGWSSIIEDYRYLIRFDASPDMLYGVFQNSIAKEE